MTAARVQAAPVRYDTEAVRLNNRGVAEMGQQFTEKAAASFAAAMKRDPKLAQAAINEGIALHDAAKAGRGEGRAQCRSCA